MTERAPAGDERRSHAHWNK